MEIKRLKELVFSGKSALDEEQARNVVSEISNILITIKRSPDLLTDESFVVNLYEIFASLINANLHTNLMESVATDGYYDFGMTILTACEETNSSEVKKLIHEYLNLCRLPEFLIRIYDDTCWELFIHDLIVASDYTLANLIDQRVRDYTNKAWLKIFQNNHVISKTWKVCKETIDKYSLILSDSLFHCERHKPADVAFLMENDPTMAMLDIACLTTGIVNVMIPANSVSQHVELILNQTEVPLVIVSDEKQLSKIKSVKQNLHFLKKVILEKGHSAEEWVESLEDLFKAQFKHAHSTVQEMKKNITCNSLATIMYTSGTTGEPKGIMFSHVNIIYKRFCRALALPQIGEHDRFLAYLPLFHTFGRYLELVGSMFWAAEYVFMEDPSTQTMVTNMQLVQPTIFISIPKKWIQLYDYISTKVDIEIDDETEIEKTVHQVTGGKLKWGLSAAGFLSSDIFQFFQRYGIELLSGFGMTEATGGITMTPPGNYKINSLGKALPGVKIKVADDGELLIKGAYVMIGYFDEDKSVTFDEDGWFGTGDVMRMDENQFIEIIDRKKEIYKNIKGETVAPQKIENLFRDFEYVKQVFLVGDHRPFNTVIIYPDREIENSIIKGMNEQQLIEYFSSLIVTVNNFLAPFERIVDFRLIDKPFSGEKGELTPKGTYKRRVIENNFKNLIDEMYQKNHTEIFVNNVEVRIPNWFLREKSVLSGDIIASDDKIKLVKNGFELTVKQIDKEKSTVQIGNFIYKLSKKHIDFQIVLTTPEVWLGNTELFQFAGDSIIQWQRLSSSKNDIVFKGIKNSCHINAETKSYLIKILNANELSLLGVHLATNLLQSEDDEETALSLKYFSSALINEDNYTYKLALELLRRPQFAADIKVLRSMFDVIIKNVSDELFGEFFRNYLNHDSNLLDESVTETIVSVSKKPTKLEMIINVVQEEFEKLTTNISIEKTALPGLIQLLSEYGIRHPSAYEKIREVLVEIQINRRFSELANIAFEARNYLRHGFRHWLGPNQEVAVDMETSEEYLWDDVIIFEDDIDKNDKEKIRGAIKNTQILMEAIFLFSKGKIVQLNNLLPGGVWVSHLRTYHNKSVYRITVQTRYQGSFELVFNLNYGRTPQMIRDEINLLILAGSKKYVHELVEDFGGYWDGYDIWSGKFVPGESVEKFMWRELRKNDESVKQRLYHIWPFFVWNAAAAYINFWRLTSYESILADPSTSNFIIPAHDYQTGTKVISLSERFDFQSVTELFRNFHSMFIKATENKYSFLKRKAIWSFVFAGVINALGDKQGLEILNSFKDELEHELSFEDSTEILEGLNSFMITVSSGDFLPKRLYFAIKRFHRWYEINTEADFTAQALMLNELIDTYRLPELEQNYPATRTKLYLETVFRDSSDSIKNEIKSIISKFHQLKISKEEEQQLLIDISSVFNLTEIEKYFLTRLTYPHLKPTHAAELVEFKIDGKASTNLVVQYEDDDGVPYYVRKPISPKEISRLHQLFIEANLLVTFKPEHEFLVAISERGFIIGGLFYLVLDKSTAHMEKIVVSNRYRRKGISDGLMNEFFDRMASENLENVTTGFFRPEYFYKFGFKVERKYSGLVKKLGSTSR